MVSLPTPEDIKKLRKKAGLTQTELAKLAGVSQSLIARIEKGTVDPRLSTLRRIIEAIKLVEMRAKKAKSAKDVMYSPVITIKSSNKVKKAIELMEKYAISQLPVVNDKGVPVGSITESTVLKKLLSGEPEKILKLKVEEIMEESFPTITPSTNIKDIQQLILKKYPAVLVMEKGKIVGIITKIDLITKTVVK
ncbi:MAG: CBS domain-containing protein [Candidatus Baldrarchaeia archaeon]|nr:MAG: transcriptional regulator [Thermofilum sp. ex4484_82]OYT35639.1 MAG: transcriptional regulator [Archaeoglobales archaeon ex4484_92]